MVGWKPEQFIKYVDYDDDRKEDEECKLPGYKRGDKTCDKIPDELMVRESGGGDVVIAAFCCRVVAECGCCCCSCCSSFTLLDFWLLLLPCLHTP